MNTRCGRLRVFVTRGPIPELLLAPRNRYSVGRAHDADCRVDAEGVSRHHLEIDTTAWPWLLTDPGSKNGTRVEGKPLGTAELTRSSWLSICGIPARIEIMNSDSAARWEKDAEARRLSASQLNQTLKPDAGRGELFDRVLSAFLQLADGTQGGLFLGNEQGQLDMVRSSGDARLPGSFSVIVEVLRTGQPVLISDVTGHHALANRDSVVSGNLKSIVCMPLRLAGEARGVLYAASTRPGKVFTQLDLELLEGLARQAAFIVALNRMRDDLARLRITLPESPGSVEPGDPFSAHLERVMPPVRE